MKQPNQQPNQQQIQVPAVRLPLTGLRSQSYILRHNAKLQKYPLDAGMDLFSNGINKVTNHGYLALIWVNTGIVVHIGPGCKGRIEPRSSSLDRLNGGEVQPGLIDAGYIGEIMIRVRVPNQEGIVKSVSLAVNQCQMDGIAIAQLIVEQCFTILPVELPINSQPAAGRGANGFGSSDVIR